MPRPPHEQPDPWYWNTVGYCPNVRLFQDSDGDGVGDLPGLLARLDHLTDLHVGLLWLQPTYPTPWRDNGYDLTDHRGVDPAIGTLEDMDRLFAAARQRGIGVVLDLVPNHTSDQHPWFRQACRDASSPYRDFYLFRREKPEHPAIESVVPPGGQVWSFQEEAGLWYQHRFYDFEPDLNNAHPEVQAELLRTVEFWMERGAAGFRVDALPSMIGDIERVAGKGEGHAFVRRLRETVRRYHDDGVLLAETDVLPEHYPDFWGDGEEVQVLTDFWTNNQLFLALAREDARPLRAAVEAVPRPPSGCGLATWVRNHDELDLERLTDEERADVLERFAPDPAMRVYDGDIRRRLGPMLGGDTRWAALTFALAFSVPGAPIIEYGAEIGLGDRLDLPERWPVRVPMQWDAGPNGGFSDAPAQHLVRRPVHEGPFSYRAVNVDDQRRDPDSLLNHLVALSRTRREVGLPGREVDTLDLPDPVLGLVHHLEDADVTCLLNLGRSWCSVTVPAGDPGQEVFADEPYDDTDDTDDTGEGTVGLRPLGYRWFRRSGQEPG